MPALPKLSLPKVTLRLPGSRGSSAAKPARRVAPPVTRPDAGRQWSVPKRQGRLWLVGDVVALLALAALTGLLWAPAFGTGWVWLSVLGGAAIGCVVGLVSLWRRWGAFVTAAVAWLAVMLFGTPLAVPGLGWHVVVPTLASLRQLAHAPVTVWRGLLTLRPPLGETGNLLAAPLWVALLATLLGLTISTRSGHSRLAWLPSAVALVVAAVFGAARVMLPAVVALAAITVILVWTTWREHQLSSALVTAKTSFPWRRILQGALVLAVAAGCTLLAAPFIAPTHRAHLREALEPPLQTEQFASPLQGFRRNVTDDKSVELFQLTGMPRGARVRLAALDAYDGLVASVGTAATPGGDDFRRIGAQVPGAFPGQEATVGVRIEALTGVWLPTVGALESFRPTAGRRGALEDSLFYNPASGTGIVTAGLERGDEYTIKVSVRPQPTAEAIKLARPLQLAQPSMDAMPASVRDLAAMWSKNAKTPGEVALTLQQKLREGYYSNGGEKEQPSLPGHNIARLTMLFAPNQAMIGDEEQYAVTMALMARSQGLPSRVVYGYTAKEGDSAVMGSQVSVWTEIAFADLGWVEFDPTPPRDRTTNIPKVQQQQKPRPQVENPPPPPERPEKLPPEGRAPVAQSKSNPWADIPWEAISRVALYGVLPLLVLCAPIAFVLGTKARRRKRRQFAPDPAARLSGGWAEIVDRARDLGARLPVADTRTEQAVHLVEQFPHLGDVADPVLLALEADAGVFAGDVVGDDAAADYWGRVKGALVGLSRGRNRWQRIRAALSLRSLRKPR